VTSIFIGLLVSLTCLCVINLDIFNNIANSELISINYLGYVVCIVIGSLIFGSFSVFIPFISKSVIVSGGVGTLFLILYIIDSGFALNFYQMTLRNSQWVMIATYLSPFTYINMLIQYGVVNATSETQTIGGMFNPFYDMSFPVGNGEFITFWYKYQI
jgi:hypothetical protein